MQVEVQFKGVDIESGSVTRCPCRSKMSSARQADTQQLCPHESERHFCQSSFKMDHQGFRLELHTVRGIQWQTIPYRPTIQMPLGQELRLRIHNSFVLKWKSIKSESFFYSVQKGKQKIYIKTKSAFRIDRNLVWPATRHMKMDKRVRGKDSIGNTRRRWYRSR